MKNMWKRLLTGMLAITLVMTGLPMQRVFATEATASEEKSQPDATETKEEYLLNYVVTEQSYVETPGSQRVVVSIGTDDCTYQNPILIYMNQESGEVYEKAADKIENNAALFTIKHDQAEEAVYSLKEIHFETEGGARQVTLKECGISAEYGVNRVVGLGNSEDDVTEEELESVNITVTDLEGNIISGESLGEVLEQAEGEMPAVFSLARNTTATAALADGKLVVVIDPGHDKTHSGASYFGALEHELTLKIATYCKEELETYSGVEVNLTRETNDCAWGKVELRECLVNRAKFAEEKGADIFVSIHLNAEETGKAKGAEIFYPNANYRPDLGTEGKGVAQAVLDQLTALGIAGRDIKVVNANEDVYPDGSRADYYRVIQETKLRGIPGIIVEHAFLSNSGDYQNYLNSDEKLKKLGVADATAIAEYYGLYYEEEYAYGAADVTYTINEEGNIYTVSAVGIPYAYGVKYAVWSKDNGQDDLKWYTAARTNKEEWLAAVPLSNHNSAGEYYIHTYIYRKDGSLYKVAEDTWNIPDTISGSVTVKNLNTVIGCFDVIVSGIYSPLGTKAVEMQVWSREDQSDIRKYTASKQNDGTYKIHIDVADHNCNFGTYQVQSYIIDSSDRKQCVNTMTVNVSKPTTVVTASLNESQSSVSLSAWHVPGTFGKSLKSVSFAVWSAKGGQDDLKWYTGKASSDKFVYNVPISNHKTTGTYYVHVYAQMSNGINQYVGGTAFQIGEAKAESVKIKNLNTVTGAFDVIVSGVSAINGIQQVVVPIWSKGDQSDIVWYEATKQGDGSYKVHMDVVNHNCNFSKYQVHTYVRNGYGVLENVDSASVDVIGPRTTVTATVDKEQTMVSISAWHVPGTFGKSLKSVSFAVWSDKGGQDDLKWYTGQASSDKFVCNVPISNHRTTGTYYVHVYAKMFNGTNRYIGGITFRIEEAKAENVEIKSLNTVTGSFDVVISGVTAINGIRQVIVPIWSKSDQSDLVWYEATKQGDGSYKVHMDVANHNCNFSKYQVHTYVRNGYGVLENVDSTSVNVVGPRAEITATIDEEQTKAILNAWHVPGTFGKSLKSVSFAVWSAEGGQDDLKWYIGQASSDKFIYTVPLNNHMTNGAYYVHVYANYSNGMNKYVGGTTFVLQDAYTKIIGISKVTANQLAAYYSDNASYPKFYADSDAPDLDTFCQIYMEECEAEGVRAEVAFCQAMKETGFLRYLGDAEIEQYNFAGLDTTGAILEDGTVDTGRSYSSVREGIRAQVQRLKAWAVEGITPSSYKYECIDADKFNSSWWVNTIIGSAPFVEWLGKHQNPSGYGWAVDPEYGYSIRDDYMAKLLKY